jgi:cobalt-precorrin 5A hydrolase
MDTEKGPDITVYVLTSRGVALGRTIADHLGAELLAPARLAAGIGALSFDRLREGVRDRFHARKAHVFVAAAGIVVRTIAPFMVSKDRDPAVVVLDQEGKFVISLLSGHLGGANDLARRVAQITGGEAVITTATDTAGLPSMDLLAQEQGLIIGNLEAVKTVNAAMLETDPIQVLDPEDRLGLHARENPGFQIQLLDREAQWIPGVPGVAVTWKKMPFLQGRLHLHPRCLVCGIGCNRGTSENEILELVKETFDREGLVLESVEAFASMDAKQDEPGLLEAAWALDVPVIFFSRHDLAQVSVPNPSKTVEKHMGVKSVCEAAALLKTNAPKLLVPKTRSRNATLAVAVQR